MHAQSSGQPVTAQRWSIPHSEYTTLQELIAAGGQASITLESSQGGDRRAIQATCHVTTTRQHPLPDVQHALRVDMQIPGQPLHHAECRAWLEELVNAIQLYANTPEPTPPAPHPELLPCAYCGGAAVVEGRVNNGMIVRCQLNNCCHTARFFTMQAATASWNHMQTPSTQAPKPCHSCGHYPYTFPVKLDGKTLWETCCSSGCAHSAQAETRGHSVVAWNGLMHGKSVDSTQKSGCCGQFQHDNQPLRIAITGLPRAGKTAAAQFLLRHHRAFVFDQPITEEEAARFRAADVTILHILRAHPGLRPDYADQSAIDIHDDDLALHNNCGLDGIGGLHAQLDAAVDLIRKRAHHCARQHPTPDSEAA